MADLTDAQLDEIHEGMTEEKFARLADVRGGCSCWMVQAPCNACCEPLTQAEAEELDLIPEPEPSIDYMAATRAMCGHKKKEAP